MASISLDITPASIGTWASTEEAGRLATQEQVVILAKELAKGLQDEFSSHNRTGETIDSVKVQVGPLSANVFMGGGASFVEYGFPPHYIEAENAQALHWESDDKYDEGFARPGIWVSGYEGDPFVQRAMDNDIDYGIALQNIAENVFKAIVKSSRGELQMSDISDSIPDSMESDALGSTYEAFATKEIG